MIDTMQTLDTRGTFNSANGIRINTDFPVIDAFKQVNKQYYDAEIQNIDFNQPFALQTINNWFDEKTRGKIPEILKEIHPLTRFILGNALYFNGYWMFPFRKQATTDLEFYTSTGSQQKVPTMRQTLHTQFYTKLKNCAALELPFGNGAFGLVVVLPDENTDISSVVERMNGDWWAQVVTGLEGPPYNMEVAIEIPRFTLEYERAMTNDLKTLGMRAPFDENAADFSLISSRKPLFVSHVLQKSFVKMDEEGMKVASATAIHMVGSNGEDDYTSVTFKVNRPFLYFIKEKSTNLVFFTGIMNKITN